MLPFVLSPRVSWRKGRGKTLASKLKVGRESRVEGKKPSPQPSPVRREREQSSTRSLQSHIIKPPRASPPSPSPIGWERVPAGRVRVREWVWELSLIHI